MTHLSGEIQGKCPSQALDRPGVPGPERGRRRADLVRCLCSREVGPLGPGAYRMAALWPGSRAVRRLAALAGRPGRSVPLPLPRLVPLGLRAVPIRPTGRTAGALRRALEAVEKGHRYEEGNRGGFRADSKSASSASRSASAVSWSRCVSRTTGLAILICLHEPDSHARNRAHAAVMPDQPRGLHARAPDAASGVWRRTLCRA